MSRSNYNMYIHMSCYWCCDASKVPVTKLDVPVILKGVVTRRFLDFVWVVCCFAYRSL